MSINNTRILHWFAIAIAGTSPVLPVWGKAWVWASVRMSCSLLCYTEGSNWGGLRGGTQKVGQEEREIFYLVMLSSGASYTLASKLKFLYFFFSLPKSSVRVLAHVFIFSLNPAEGVEQLKCLRLCLCWNYSVAQRRKYCGIGTEKGGDTLCVSQTCGWK